MDQPLEPTRNREEPPNVASALSQQAQRQPNAIAIHYPRSGMFRARGYASCTYKELDGLSESYARGLAAYGIGPGARAALLLAPGLDFFAMLFALFRGGATPVLVDPGMAVEPLKQCLAEAAPKAFIATARARLPRKVLGWAKGNCELLITAGSALGRTGIGLEQLRKMGELGEELPVRPARPDDMAAILFTAGSTGAPKGVVYRHRHFEAQASMLRDAFGIRPGEVSLAAYSPLALLDPALGLTTVVPDIDPARPAPTDPARLVAAIDQHRVTGLFGAPALLDALSSHCVDQGIRLDSVTRIITAGAAVPPDTARRMQRALYNDAKVHVSYGAAECLPVSSISAGELDDRMVERIESGDGVCVGRPIDPNRVRIIGISDIAIGDIAETTEMPFGMPGEIAVSGPACADSYWAREADTAMAKFTDEQGAIWHRTGDVGILDGAGRLWYCGRVSQRIETGQETLFADQCEAIFNQHPDLRRSAVVGVGPRGRQLPVLCIELKRRLSAVDNERVHFDLLQLAQAHTVTRSIRTVLVHPGFAVDVRHSAAIGREELAKWAEQKMQS